jgi:hypothetical protein
MDRFEPHLKSCHLLMSTQNAARNARHASEGFVPRYSVLVQFKSTARSSTSSARRVRGSAFVAFVENGRVTMPRVWFVSDHSPLPTYQKRASDHRLLLRMISTTRGNKVTLLENKVSVSVSVRGSGELERYGSFAIDDMHQHLQSKFSMDVVYVGF